MIHIAVSDYHNIIFLVFSFKFFKLSIFTFLLNVLNLIINKIIKMIRKTCGEIVNQTKILSFIRNIRLKWFGHTWRDQE